MKSEQRTSKPTSNSSRYLTLGMSFGLQKNSEFFGLIKDYFHRMDEIGVTEMQFNRWSIDDESVEEGAPEELGFRHIVAPFLVLGFGCLTGVIIEIVSVFVRMWQRALVYRLVH